MGFDKIDLNILRELQQDSSLTNQELADRVGLSASPCLRRVKALEESGVIDRSVTLLNQSKLGLKLTAFIQISMDRHTPDRFEVFEKTLESFPEVKSCNLVTGQSADYLIEVVVEDMDRYQEFLLGRLTRIPGVTGVHSSFLLRRIINRTSLPLDHLI
ncbi:MAG: Lrp/AsnC family transcriptional regulator [Gammaproteobacteria bacterium]|jgi:Lrp/AsnC family transcriptional regulator, leucine-responsive regulatory protein|uniref:Lrp/AsnC family transcriptional regulator n=1 Tax=Marinomonas TaxID=28253 RepID=UPI000C1F075E|nr:MULTISPECIES: Lrp/AsnC family transcriptional regulator [unclassified Marinomonas]MBU1296726.1 Lrp/AsnC family transcriptional regulator [Gammaproteobacteria bacterium]MBU1468423.1 Lrp/AsnC family transcriptional regulator [Gammaproteobacteria bacterium]MBU2023264.1 Lrp/AsnC family transcriptional regulator [Gammaproteobacteria bacterium]MBU2240070.1 Lrp/AsnC family transcriptional regulator [Gammaproteobacteria bacterium]MBU2319413.1 Lrp/AsnC family transcriptional regulator [Gammaproteoba|tara:strand:- start:2911 stop:3384 length:474 start_codon:yes stop_codon:yes gene_type:complete